MKRVRSVVPTNLQEEFQTAPKKQKETLPGGGKYHTVSASDSFGEKVSPSLSLTRSVGVIAPRDSGRANTEEVLRSLLFLETHNLQSVEFLPCGETEDSNCEIKRKGNEEAGSTVKSGYTQVLIIVALPSLCLRPFAKKPQRRRNILADNWPNRM